MSEQFTKWPWVVKGDWMIVDSTERLIAQFEPLNDELSNSNTEESFANAALIACAPEMYEMLKKVSQLIDNDGGAAIDWLIENTFDIRELLSKARGES